MQMMSPNETLHAASFTAGLFASLYNQFPERIPTRQEPLLLPLRMEVNRVLFCFLSCCNQKDSRICGDRRGIMSLSLPSGVRVSSTPTAALQRER